jgi:hypothetical protein
MARRTLTAVHRGTFDSDEPSEWILDEFADLTRPEVLSALGFVRERADGHTVYRTHEDDDSLVVLDQPDIDSQRPYKRAVVTVTMVANWYPVSSVSFVWTNTPVHGPAYRIKATSSKHRKSIDQEVTT